MSGRLLLLNRDISRKQEKAYSIDGERGKRASAEIAGVSMNRTARVCSAVRLSG